MSDVHRLKGARVMPAGTQVVTLVEITDQFGRVLCPRGAVGVVVAEASEDTPAYTVRFIDGSELALIRKQVAVLKHFKKGLLLEDEAGLPMPDMYDYVVYRCVVGSRAYGLDEGDSDYDRRGFYLPPAHVTWSLPGAPEQLENDATQECYWEIQTRLNPPSAGTSDNKTNPNENRHKRVSEKSVGCQSVEHQ